MFLTNTEAADTAVTTPTEELSFLDKLFSFDWGLPDAVEAILNKCIEVVAVIIVLLILCKIVDLITRKIRKNMQKREVDKTVTQVTYTILNKGLKLLLLFMAISLVGIDTSSIVGLITAAGLGISLAVQGTLSNFAGGLLILVLRPFKLDDYIECQGVGGTVEEIHIFYTHLRTPDNKVILVPNGELIAGNITNYSTKPTRRVDLNFTIDYDSDHKLAQKVIYDVCTAHNLVLKDPEASVRITEFADSAIVITSKVWTKNEDYWTVTFDLLEEVYDKLLEAGIKIPYNQLEISYREAITNKEKEIGK